MGNFTWHGDEYLEHVREVYSARLEMAAQVLCEDTKELIEIQGPPPSKPGEPSHKDSGDMYESVTVRGEGLSRQVGSPMDRFVYQNLGTGSRSAHQRKTKNFFPYNKATPSQIVGIEPRPSAVPALMNAAQKIVNIVVNGTE